MKIHVKLVNKCGVKSVAKKTKLLIILFTIMNSIFGISIAIAAQTLATGFIDNGSWQQKGSIFVEVVFSSTKNRELFYHTLYEKHSKELQKDKVITLSDDFFALLPFEKGKALSIYSDKGYLGVFNIVECVVIVNHCGGGDYAYYKLNGRLDSFVETSIIATAKMAKAIITATPVSLEEKIIRQELKAKLQKAISEHEETLKTIVQEENEEPNFSLNYKTFTFSSAKSFTNIIVNVVWEWKSKYGYSNFFTNTFLMLGVEKTVDLLPVNMCFLGSKVIPKLLFGIDTDGDGNIEWVFQNEAWEGTDTIVMEWNGVKFYEVFRSNYFGC